MNMLLKRFNFRQTLLLFLVVVLTFVIAGGFTTTARAEILVRYDPGANDQVGGVISGNPLSPDSVKSTSMSASLLVQNQVSIYVNPNTWPVDATDAFDPADYVSFTVTPHSTAELVFDNLTWTGSSYNDSALSLVLRVSLDGFTEDIGAFGSIGPGPREWVADFDLSVLPPLSNSEIEFRIYPVNSGPQPDWTDLKGSLIGGTGLTLNGTATEPSQSLLAIPPAGRATGTDNGPADGVFDEIVGGDYYSWNGYTDLRHAVEFDLSDLPEGLVSVTLRFQSYGYADGPRFMQVNGYAGDGAIQLTDFEQDNLLGSTAVDPDYEIIELDVTDFVLDLIRRSESAAGFNLREEPVCGDALDCVTILVGDVSLDFRFIDVSFSDSYEDDGRIRVSPTITGPGNQVIDEDTSTGPLAFQIDDDHLVSALTVSAASSDPVRVPADRITLGGSGADRTIDIDPPDNQNGGPVTITIMVTDSENLSSTHEFDLTINPVNDQPVVTNPDVLVSLGNVGLMVSDPLLLQVSDIDGDTVTTVAGTFATSEGGSVTIHPDGTFTYDPPAGFQGGDTFGFTVDDNSGAGNSSASGIASIQVSDIIWFVDDSNAGSGSGTLNDPFKNLAAFSTAPDQAGESIFIHQGSYAPGPRLLNSQVVIGDGYTQPLAPALGVILPQYSYPLPVPTGIDPVISGGGTGLLLGSGNTIRGLTVGNTTGYGITGDNVGSLVISDSSINGTGGGLFIDTGTLSVQLEELSASGSGQYGLRLEGVAGTVGIQRGTIAMNGAPAVKIESIGSTTLDITLTSLGSSGSPSNGLLLSETSGTFTVTGDGAASQNGSGGTILNAASDGISLSGVTGISLNRMVIQGSGGNGLKGENVTNFTLNRSKFIGNGNAAGEHSLNFSNNLLGEAHFTNSLISGSYHHGIRILNDTGTLNPLELTGMEIRDNNLTFGLDGLSLRVESNAVVVGTVTNSTFDNNRGTGIDVQGEASALADLNISGSTFSDGQNGVAFISAESSDMLFEITGGNTFTRLGMSTGGRAIGLFTTDNSTTSARVAGTITGNTISNTQNALNVNQAGRGELLLDFSSNTAMTGMQLEAVFMRLGQTAPDLVAVSNVTMNNNVLGPSVSGFNPTVDILMRPQAVSCFNIRNNSITSANNSWALDLDSTGTAGKIESQGNECGGVCANAKSLLEAANTVITSVGNNVDPMTFVAPGICLRP